MTTNSVEPSAGLEPALSRYECDVVPAGPRRHTEREEGVEPSKLAWKAGVVPHGTRLTEMNEELDRASDAGELG